MPIKIQTHGDASARIAALRSTIPDGEGLSMNEVAERAGCSLATAMRNCRLKGWIIRTYDPNCRHVINVLVNPKTQQQYANKDRTNRPRKNS